MDGAPDLLLIDNLASISLLDLSQYVKKIFSSFLSLPTLLAYAQANIAAKLSPANKHGEWTPTTREEIYSLLAVLLHQALNRLPEVKDYWYTELFFDGNYVRSMRKVRYLYDHMQDTCQTVFVLGRRLSVDERMKNTKGAPSSGNTSSRSL